MLKEMIICIIIVVVIFFGNSTIQKYTKESVSEISNGLMQLREDLTNQNVENNKAKEKMNEVYSKWEKKHDKLAYFIEHDELEKVETDLVSIKSYIETQEYEQAVGELDKGAFVLKHIEDKYAFNLQNIF
ncbi:MAG: DUF4363 family protein [Clostridia bacterium]|nr:DUF4363 family protein [Clostridia bacterium]